MDGAIAAAPAPDTLKRAAEALIAGTVERAGLWGAQTPQAFWAPALRAAIAAAAADGTLAGATDCASLLEAARRARPPGGLRAAQPQGHHARRRGPGGRRAGVAAPVGLPAIPC